MSYKSVRLLTEAIHSKFDEVRKAAMRVIPQPGDSVNAVAEEHERLKELRQLIDELSAKADRPTIDDVVKLSPADYVATMKPLVGQYHRLLMANGDLLASCLCEDLQTIGIAVLLIGDQKTSVRTAYDPNHPEAAIAIEALIQTIDKGMLQVMTEGVAEAEKQLGIEVPVNPLLETKDAEKPE